MKLLMLARLSDGRGNEKHENVFVAPLLHLISPNFAFPMRAANKHAP
jgi:hypothetical protein